MNEVIIKGLKCFFLLLEIETIRDKKNLAVRRQDFEEAQQWREKEKELLNLAPSLDEITELRKLILEM